MKVDDKIVFLDGGYPAIFFPVGTPASGGTCAYLTTHCLLYCPAQETNKHEIRVLNFFKENNEKIITNKILEDISSYQFMGLYWWPWGDCLPELTNKITTIMVNLSAVGIIQNGFTRNPHLWKSIQSLGKSTLKIGFHVDTIEEAKTMSDGKIICCPDITVNKAEMYFNGKKIARCCGTWTEWIPKEKVRICDCQECYIYKQGCFFITNNP